MSDEDAQPMLAHSLHVYIFFWNMPMTFGLYEKANHEAPFLSGDDMVSYLTWCSYISVTLVTLYYIFIVLSRLGTVRNVFR